MSARTVAVYDTTLRDGSQGHGLSLTSQDKLKIARALDALGVSYIEGGWPGSNPKDIEFFEAAAREHWKHARIAAFGSTRKAGTVVDQDRNVQLLLEANTPTVTIVGKASRFQVDRVLGTTAEENLRMVADTVAFLKRNDREVLFDAEHFFDGWNDDRDYALSVCQAAAAAGADAIILCDTNGGAMPGLVFEAVKEIGALLSCPVGIHTHNDCELAIANAVAAVEAGAIQVQGTVNGYGERVGNANLCSLIPVVEHKMGFQCLPEGNLHHLTETSRYIAEVANVIHDARLPFVGTHAFTHKAGLHVNAVAKDPVAYEHMDPEIVGNGRHVLVSELSGRSNVIMKAETFGIDLRDQPQIVTRLVAQIKELEHQGYWFEDADASLELLIRRAMDGYVAPFEALDYTVLAEYRRSQGMLSEAMVKLDIHGETYHTASEGNGPVNALDTATRKALLGFYPQIANVELEDYKVRVLDDHHGTGAVVRVWIRSGDGVRSWQTVGSSPNVIAASWMALADSLTYSLVVPVNESAAKPSMASD
ncbi:MAG: citramalate synthase [Thermomicrobiaceae bacterium]